MTLDFSSFEKALTSLEAVLKVEKNDIVRDSAIQRFEYTYELSVKMLHRHLETTSPSAEDIDHMSYKTLIRTGAERGLIDDPESWFAFREKRNITSHTYDQEKAEAVYAILPSFAVAARALLLELKARNA